MQSPEYIHLKWLWILNSCKNYLAVSVIQTCKLFSQFLYWGFASVRSQGKGKEEENRGKKRGNVHNLFILLKMYIWMPTSHCKCGGIFLIWSFRLLQMEEENTLETNVHFVNRLLSLKNNNNRSKISSGTQNGNANIKIYLILSL